MKKKILFVLIFSLFISCKKKTSDTKPLSPANGTYLMTIHAKGVAGRRGGSNFDSTYSDYLTISGTLDSINVKCLNVEDNLYILYEDSEDSLNYYMPWPPPASGYSGSFYFSKLTHKAYLKTRYEIPGLAYGSTEYILTQQ